MVILYIGNDTVASVSPAQQKMPISTAVPVVGALYDIWGWGIRYAGGAPPRDLQVGNGSAKISVSGIASNGANTWFYAYATGNARTCQGDSGGPSTRYYNGTYIATGVHFWSYYTDPATEFYPCAEANVRMDWPNTYDKIAWIESTLRIAYGAGFSCARVGAAPNSYMRCF